MQYLVYVLVATPLLLGWLFWESAHIPPSPPLFASGLEHLSTQPVRQAAAAPVASPNGTRLSKRRLVKNEAPSTE
jgi:hypothetical protein